MNFYSTMQVPIKHLILCLTILSVITKCQTAPVSESEIDKAFGQLNCAFVIVDCFSEATTIYKSDIAKTKFAPCSTFKIWNVLIGLENDLISSPDEPFYKWDNVERAFAAWNKDLTLKEAFQASCVPAFQNLARRIGSQRMQSWINRIEYGNQDTSSGIDVFWLPAKNRKPLLISPIEQTNLLKKLITGQMPFSKESLPVLLELMLIKKTDNGILYGKTGSGTDDNGTFVLGWFVGFVLNNGKTHAFACVAQGENVMSKHARGIAEAILEKQELL